MITVTPIDMLSNKAIAIYTEEIANSMYDYFIEKDYFKDDSHANKDFFKNLFLTNYGRIFEILPTTHPKVKAIIDREKCIWYILSQCIILIAKNNDGDLKKAKDILEEKLDEGLLITLEDNAAMRRYDLYSCYNGLHAKMAI